MKTVSWETAKNNVHDASGIKNPEKYLWEQQHGIYYPVNTITETVIPISDNDVNIVLRAEHIKDIRIGTQLVNLINTKVVAIYWEGGYAGYIFNVSKLDEDDGDMNNVGNVDDMMVYGLDAGFKIITLDDFYRLKLDDIVDDIVDNGVHAMYSKVQKMVGKEYGDVAPDEVQTLHKAQDEIKKLLIFHIREETGY